MGSTDRSCQNTHSCLSGYGLSFFNMVILNSALFPLFSAVGGDPFTWRAGVDGAPDEDGDDAVAVAMDSVCVYLGGIIDKEN